MQFSDMNDLPTAYKPLGEITEEERLQNSVQDDTYNGIFCPLLSSFQYEDDAEELGSEQHRTRMPDDTTKHTDDGDEWDLDTITDGMEVLEIATATLLSEPASGQPKQTEWSRPRPPSPFSATFIIIPHSKDTKHFMNKIHNTIYSQGELLSDYTDELGLYDYEENKYSRVAFSDYELCIYNCHHPSVNALRDTRNVLLQRPLKSCLKVKSNPFLAQDMVLLQEADDVTWDEWYGTVLRDNSYLIRNPIYQIDDRLMEKPQHYVPEAKSAGVELEAVKYETAKL